MNEILGFPSCKVHHILPAYMQGPPLLSFREGNMSLITWGYTLSLQSMFFLTPNPSLLSVLRIHIETNVMILALRANLGSQTKN